MKKKYHLLNSRAHIFCSSACSITWDIANARHFTTHHKLSLYTNKLILKNKFFKKLRFDRSYGLYHHQADFNLGNFFVANNWKKGRLKCCDDEFEVFFSSSQVLLLCFWWVEMTSMKWLNVVLLPFDYYYNKKKIRENQSV